jgi:dATP pyrophosphohydrolase
MAHTSRRTGRAPFQVLVLPYRRLSTTALEYALFHRAPPGRFWQGITGGGEDDETPWEAALREAKEEAGIGSPADLLPLDSTATIPVVGVMGGFHWGPDVLVVPEYAFGLRCRATSCVLSDEHDEYRWFSFREASRRLHWDSNRNALWELDHRLRTGNDRRTR